MAVSWLVVVVRLLPLLAVIGGAAAFRVVRLRRTPWDRRERERLREIRGRRLR